MRVNKVFFQSILAFLFVSILFLPLNSFAKETLDVEKIVIKIDDSSLAKDYLNSDQVVVFSESGRKEIIVENNSTQAIDVIGVRFAGDEFVEPIAQHIYVKKANSTLQPKSSSRFVIGADEKAIPTINPKGMPLALVYKKVGDKKERFVGFKVKLNYNNNYLSFKERNVGFRETNALEDNRGIVFEGELNIYRDQKGTPWYNNKCRDLGGTFYITNRSQGDILIKDLRLIKDGEKTGVIIYNNCNSLKSGGICEVEFIVDCKVKKTHDVLPLWVTYDVVTPSEQKKDLVAVAAAVINPRKMQLFRAFLSGYLCYETIKLACVDFGSFAKTIFTDYLGEGIGAVTATKATEAVSAGVFFVFLDKFANYIGYDSRSFENRLASSTILYAGLASMSCLKEGVNNPAICMVMSIASSLFAKYATGYIENSIFPNIVYRLPEEGSLDVRDDEKIIFDFGMMAGIRVPAKAALKVPYGNSLTTAWLTEVFQDSASGATMYGLGRLEKRMKNILPVYQGQFGLGDGVGGELPEFLTDEDKLHAFYNASYCPKE